MNSVEELLHKQSQAMRSVERALTNFKKLGQAKMTVAVTQNRMTMIKETFAQCQDLDAKISAMADHKTKATFSYFVEDLFATCEENYQEALDFMAEVLMGVSPAPDPAAANGHPSNIRASHPTAHLPRIDLPTFDGAFDKWESYRDRFSSMVIGNKSLSNVDRLHFLYASLKGEASNAVSHLPVTENNFEVAWKVITSRYENKRRLISTHLNALFTLPTVVSETQFELRALRDKINMSIEMLRNLGRPVDQWSDIIVYLGTQKLDRATRKAWELNLGDTTAFPTYREFDEFLEKRIRALEAMPTVQRDKPSAPERSKQLNPKTFHAYSTATTKLSCPSCNQDHLLYQCSEFLAKSPSNRYQFIKNQNRCVNCFSVGHSTAQCKNPHCCKECRQRHHTLLHFPGNNNSSTTAAGTSSRNSQDNLEVSSNLASNSPFQMPVLLSTARVQVHSHQGRCVHARALLDQGSAATLITENLAQLLRLKRTSQYTRISGIGEKHSFASQVAAITITPADRSEPAYSTTAIVMQTLTKYVPSRQNQNSTWSYLSGLNLADKDPMSSDQIDLIIGADIYGQLLLEGVIRGSGCAPTAQNTTLGWILSGPFLCDPRPTDVPVHHLSVLEHLDRNLRRFWEIEDLPSSAMLTPEEQKCERHFLETHSRTKEGRYVVRLPFRDDQPVDLGSSRLGTLNRLRSLENRLSRDQNAYREYHNFLSEYATLGHMRRVDPPSFQSNHHAYYIPHHAVIRQTSQTTRLRVVFNASNRTSNGKSLNQFLYPGPKLQQDLTAIIIRWRLFQYVYAADIAKMYRQIRVNQKDVDFQRILWRESPAVPVQEYQLLTVTYGTTPAPYLALRVLKQLVEDEGSSYPLAVQVLNYQTYVDDFLFGSDDPTSLRRIRNETIQLLQRGGFSLRKWSSNDSRLLSDIDEADHGLAVNKSLNVDENISVLGLAWNPSTDLFQFHASKPSDQIATKREILSSIAKLFDPMGWVAPFVVSAKFLIQQLWTLKCDWDDPVPPQYLRKWQSFCAEFAEFQSLTIPRKISPKILISQSLHGFADASTKAYAAVVYLRSILEDGTVTSAIIMAKTRVAPVKTVSVPRLELCAALLLARLIKFIHTSLLNRPMDCHCWTDSKITLTWVNQSPSRWKTFVANRVAKIQNIVPQSSWHHVPTDDNPADCASRGIPLTELKSHRLWWSGPQWLQLDPREWPHSGHLEAPEASGEERVQEIKILTATTAPWELEKRYSSWTKLLRVTAYIKRFISNLQTQTKRNLLTKPIPSTKSSPSVLSPKEIHGAELFWIRRIQSEVFSTEMNALHHARTVSRSSPLHSLNPFLDHDGLIRARGRLSHARLPAPAKTPIILKAHPLLTLLISSTHHQLLHAGLQLTLAHLRNRYWIIRARTTIRAVLHRCVACTRERAAIPHELMGSLPAPRVERVERPFTHTGVDYAGPILARTTPGRGHKSVKAYIAIFVCLTIKAVHIELVSDYSSQAFIAAFHRFVSRRGLPTAMYSDNGTTFHGANRELTSAHKSATKDPNFNNFLASKGISWHFLPPNAPHFGGLWEAAVKSLKYHLKRTIGSHTLTFEELSTVLCRIEACLNSRPLGGMSDCLEEYSVLTPGHFLIGTPLVAQPEPSTLNLNENRLSRWQLLQRLTEKLWKSWQQDYLHSLSQRPKWRTVQNLAKNGQLVLLRNPNLPPCKWELGRIVECHPGSDGLVRVVTVKTAHSTYKRPITRVCFLPVSIHAATTNEPSPK